MTQSISSGSSTVFRQSTAPLFWQKVTTFTDHAIRVVNTSGGVAGGSTAFSTVFSNRTVNATVTGVTSVTHSAVTLSSAQNGSHAHEGPPTVPSVSGTTYLHPSQIVATPVPIAAVPNAATSPAWLTTGQVTAASGGNGSHSHPGGGGAPSPVSAPLNVSIKYVDVILCQRG
jgi:hypothetical protein